MSKFELKIMEQRININFYFKLGKRANETRKMLQQVCGIDALSRSRYFEWFRWFLDARKLPKIIRTLEDRYPHTYA